MTKQNFQPSVHFIGRKTELQQLHQALNSVTTTKRAKFILIQGDFGVGKTALVERFLSEVSAHDSSILIGQGKCAIETELNGLIPFSQLLASLTEQGIQRRVVTGSLTKFVKEVAPAWLDVLTGGILGAAVKTVQEGGKLLGRTTFSKESIFVQYTNAVSQLSQKRPILAFIDDLQWADASSLGLLFHMSRYLQDCPILVICTYRPVEATETGSNAALFRDVYANLIRYGAMELELRQGIDVIEYVAQRYPNNTFSSNFIEHIQEKTEGHALFVNQLFSWWEETGVIACKQNPDGQFVWGVLQEVLELPSVPSVQKVLDARIRLMEADLREMLVCASVEGEDFTAQAVTRLRQLDEYKIYDGLETLAHHYHLIQEKGSKEIYPTIVLDFYRFVHRFFREHIYNQLSSGKRRILHRLVAECLEALYAQRDEIAGQLALHFHEAHEQSKTVTYALMAAKFEKTRYAWSEAEKWCQLGLKALEKLPLNPETEQLQLDILECSGHAYNVSGQFLQAYKRYLEALNLAKQPERIADICDSLSGICEFEGRLDDSLTFINRGKKTLNDHAITFGVIHAQLDVSLAIIHERFGNRELAVESLRKLLSDVKNLDKKSGIDYIRADAYNALGISLGHLNDYPEASEAYEQSVVLAISLGDKWLEAIYQLNLAENYFYMGELKKCGASAEKGLKIAQQIGDLDSIAYAYTIKAEILLEEMMPKDAKLNLERALNISENIGSFWNMAIIFANLALTHLYLTEFETAHNYAIRGINCAEEKKLRKFSLGYAIDALGQVEAAQKNWQEAAQNFEKAILVHQQIKDRHFAARSQRQYAITMLDQGEFQKSLELLKIALIAFQELKLTHEIEKTTFLLTKVERHFAA